MLSTRPTPAERFDIDTTLRTLYDTLKDLDAGNVASYIPELAKACPDWFGITLCSPEGEIFEIGDARQQFTIQSISKPLVYGQALDAYGRAFVASRVGVEPTGDAFHSIISLDEKSKRPHNPMVNAGAIAMTSLIQGATASERLSRLLDTFQRYVGHPVAVDMPTYTSERSTGHRNRAIAHLMLNFGMIEGSVEEQLDLYFQQCAVLVDCRDLAVIAATLANRGINPLTGDRAVHEEHVRDLLSVMFTCGLYDYAGEWAYEVGFPAKSGVGGGILAVVPNRWGIGVFSPRLDARGNSVRGIEVCKALSRQWRLHLFDAPSP
ncbi:glutaminase A [bacterium]|nr:glutaminase A [bacterium]